MLLNFSVELLKKLIYNGHALIRFLPLQHEEGGSGADEFEEMESNEIGGMVLKSEVVPVENLIAPTTNSSLDEKRKTVHNGIGSILEGIDKCQYEGFELIASSDYAESVSGCGIMLL